MPEEQIAEARQRNDQLVEQLKASGSLSNPEVEAALRSVFRHHFVPGQPLAEVYEDAAITTKTGEMGRPISSSSQPGIMVWMLQQLRMRAGQRVLEIGAGTGYNAALLAHLVGPRGRVVSLDFDQDLCQGARQHLATAGVDEVEVLCADGARGWPDAAPYDRIIVTASAADIAPAWFEQLLPQGRLVLPLVLAGPGHLSVGFQKRNGCLQSDTVSWCGFIPLRGELAFDPGQLAAAPGVARWLEEEPRETGFDLPGSDLRAGFEAWLALHDATYVAMRVDPAEPPTFGLRGEQGLAVVAQDGPKAPIVTYGSAREATARLLAAYGEWARRRPRVDEVEVTALPTPAQFSRAPDVRIFERPHYTFQVRWPPA